MIVNSGIVCGLEGSILAEECRRGSESGQTGPLVVIREDRL